MRDTSYTFNSLHLGVPIFKIKGGGSQMGGGSSWVTMACAFKTKKQCIEYIDHMDATQPKSTEGQRIKWKMILEQNIKNNL
jgi:hypothetical protein